MKLKHYLWMLVTKKQHLLHFKENISWGGGWSPSKPFLAMSTQDSEFFFYSTFYCAIQFSSDLQPSGNLLIKVIVTNIDKSK